MKNSEEEKKVNVLRATLNYCYKCGNEARIIETDENIIRTSKNKNLFK